MGPKTWLYEPSNTLAWHNQHIQADCRVYVRGYTSAYTISGPRRPTIRRPHLPRHQSIWLGGTVFARRMFTTDVRIPVFWVRIPYASAALKLHPRAQPKHKLHIVLQLILTHHPHSQTEQFGSLRSTSPPSAKQFGRDTEYHTNTNSFKILNGRLIS